MIIRHNLSSLNTNYKLQRNQSNTTKTMAKLSTGMRINGAADDAAGLAITEKMRAQIRGLMQSQRNIQDGISLLQTAEGALSTIDSPILLRMRELMVQAANDTLGDNDRDKIQDEILQLKKEINNISANTEFNTKKLINGTFKEAISQASLIKEQVDPLRDPLAIVPGQNDRLYFTLDGVASSVQLDEGTYLPDAFIQSINAKLSGQSLPIKASLKDGKVVLTQRPLPPPVTNHDPYWLDFSYLTSTEGLNMVPGAAFEWTGNGDNVFGTDIVAGLNDTLNMDVDGTSYTITITPGSYGNSSLLMNEINNQFALAGVDIKMYNFLPPPWNRTETLLKSATFGVDHLISNLTGNAYSQLFGCEIDWGTVTRIQGFADITQGMTVVSGVNDTLNFLAGGVPSTIVLRQGNYDGNQLVAELNAQFAASGTGVSVSTYDHLPPRSGKALFFERNGVGPNTLKLISGNALNQLTLYSVSPEVKRPASPYQVVGSADLSEGLVIDYGINDQLHFTVDGVEKSLRLNSGNYTAEALLDEINEKLLADHAGVQAKYVNNKLAIVHNQSGPVHNIGHFTGNAALPLFGEIKITEPEESEQTVVPIFNVVEKDIEQLLANPNKLALQIGANQGQVILFSLSQIDTESLHLSQISAATQEEAAKAISRIDLAKSKVTSERTKLGALQNTLEHTSERLSNYEINIVAAESRIRDVDMAKEMMEFTKSDILKQSAQAMLAQANLMPQGIMSLLR